MSKDPQDFDDFETDEFEAMPEDEITSEPVLSEEPVEEPIEVAEPLEAEETFEAATPADEVEETEAPTKKGKKSKKAKKEKTARDPSEPGGFSKFIGQQFPDVYSVMLVIAFVAILIAIAVLAIELSRYDFDMKPTGAMLVFPQILAESRFV